MAEKICLLHAPERGRSMERNKKTKKIITAVIVALSVSTTSALAAGPEYLVPGGEAVGINVYSDGVVVAETTGVETEQGTVRPAEEAGIRPGDVIVKVGICDVRSGEDLRKALERTEGETTIQVERGGELKQMCITPCVNTLGQKTIGILARDRMAGIGTLTWYDSETGEFGALGHEISDGDTQIVFPLKNGNIMETGISEVVKGSEKAPGRLQGSFTEKDTVGSISRNTVCGIYGVMEKSICTDEPMPVAEPSEVHPGEAMILSTVDETGVQEYEIEITRVYTGGEHETRNMMITITDEELLEKTGGIVQGMSGSPIIQDGKLVGAVTHVLMSDSSKGYGIFIENMLEAAA